MNWNPLPAARAAAQRAIRAFHGDLPPAVPPITLSAALREAKRADVERNVQRQELADMRAKITFLSEALQDSHVQESVRYDNIFERVCEMHEARQMAGSGAWLAEAVRPYAATPELATKLKESEPAGAIGAFGDVELALQNVEWRREINLSWLEFSRWGIQQIILISRLYYIKHPWIRRGVNLIASYVFGQGVELSSPNPKANDILKRFRERNKVSLGLIALMEAERKKSYDGNLFWVLFADKDNSGDVNVRMIDATEIQDIICDPNDSDTPWYYRRNWTARNFDVKTGAVFTVAADAWYPALGYDPVTKPKVINSIEVKWDSPVYHRKCGAVAKWHFGCPRIYPALDWCREGRRFLEAFASVWQALRQIALVITTKGGQQALEGVKVQMGTTVGPTAPIWDTNPPAVAGGTFASGTGTKLEAFKSSGAGGSASDVKEFRNMVACVLEIPPTWLGDMETSNLSTATTLDRPTELGMMGKQEEWQEDLVVMGCYQLQVSATATNGKLREAYGEGVKHIEIREAPRRMKDCHWVYEASKKQTGAVIEVLCTFPAIREGDRKLNVDALVESMTLGNKGGEIVGIDAKEGVRALYKANGIDNGDEIVENQYPDATYDPERTQEIEPAPISNKPPYPMPGQPEVKPGQPQPQPGAPMVAKSKSTNEAMSRLLAALQLRESDVTGAPPTEVEVAVNGRH